MEWRRSKAEEMEGWRSGGRQRANIMGCKGEKWKDKRLWPLSGMLGCQVSEGE